MRPDGRPVEAASDGAADVELADAVRGMARAPAFGALLDDCLDALGKGFSAVEIIWDRSGAGGGKPAFQWRPARYEWRDPRFFVFDRDDGRTLRLLDEADSLRGVPLQPCKWIAHVPRLKSGLPARGGLARLGRYGPGSTETDIEELMRAVSHLGSDAAAVLPDSMQIEFSQAGNRTGGAREARSPGARGRGLCHPRQARPAQPR